MAIVLGGVTLNPNLTWPDRDSWSNVAMTRLRTLGGTQVVFSSAATGGRRITLVGAEDQGWFTKEQKDSILALADVAGATYTLIVGAASYSVMFLHEEPPAVTFTPLISRAVDLVGDYFIGEIKLFTI